VPRNRGTIITAGLAATLCPAGIGREPHMLCGVGTPVGPCLLSPSTPIQALIVAAEPLALDECCSCCGKSLAGFLTTQLVQTPGRLATCR